jgi:hypothetical protein
VTPYAYCLMPNHVHLVVRTVDATLARFMQGLQQSYTQRFNRRHGQVGHVFQGRYKAVLCGTDEYLVTLVRYVHLNPVRAGLVARAEDYPYSGHRAYLAGTPTDLVDPTPVLRLVGGPRAYAGLVSGEAAGGALPPPPPPPDTRPGPPTGPAGRPWTGPPVPRAPLEGALSRLASLLGADLAALRGPDRSRAVCRARAITAFVLVRRLGYRLADVAAALARDGATTSIGLSRLGQRLRSDPVLADEVTRLAQCTEVKA